MTDIFDALQYRPHDERLADFFGRFPEFLKKAIAECPGLARHLGQIDPLTMTSAEALAALPILRKSELMAMQSETPPFGGFAPDWALRGSRIFMSPGPIWEPQGAGSDPWSAGPALHAAGFRSGDIVLNTLAYHVTPGGFILDEGLRALECCVIPSGPGQSEAQANSAATLGVTGYVGTPDFLKVILDKADELNLDLSRLNKALVSGGALFPAMREAYRARGVSVMQAYATADLGVISYETKSDGELCGGLIIVEDLFVEIVRPGSTDPLPHGEVGEVVVTTLNSAYPLIRFGTGDLSAILDEPSPCGRTNLRLKGWMGRADQRTKVKGMFVDPVQIERIVRSSGSVSRARLVVTRDGDQDKTVLLVTPSEGGAPNQDALAELYQSETGLKTSVEVVESSAIANDGLVVEDQRDYQS